MTSTTLVPALILSRTYDVAPEHVFAAWTDPQIAAKFFGPGNVKATNIQMDVRVGGRYSIDMLMEDGSTMKVGGVYREVQPPKRLSMTWRWDEDDPADEYDTLLTLEFFDRGGKTELVLTHDQFLKLDSRDNHARGWNAILDQLTGAL
ncbi:MAG: SRPBCC domain-containing protein [Candidatus Eremiobacteraeota bacterium]|nr:SRPBCC domain-containing protein [Candidatus Eremiobacteraeota bacterium]